MKIIFLNVILLISFIQCGFGQLTGKVTARDGKPVPYVNVLVLNPSDSSLVKGVAADERGEYSVERISNGKYFVRYVALGYQTVHTPVFEISAGEKAKNLGSQVIEESSQQLGTVLIQAEKPLFQQEIDRTVINVENSILTKGSSALQVLERSPGVYIDRQSNNIALNGKNGVMVMMNGKLLRLPLNQVVTMLNGMSANNIEKIELLTTPPAKYDAEGNAGMINIVMKKSEEEGTKGSVSLSGGYGYGEKGTASVNLAHSDGKISVYGSYAYSRDRSYSDWYAKGYQNAPTMGGAMTFDFWNKSKPIQDNHNAVVGIDANLGKTILGSSITYNNSLVNTKISNRGEYTIKSDSFLLMRAGINSSNRWQNVISTVYLEHKIKDGEKINFDIDYIYYINEGTTNVGSSFSGEENQELSAGGMFAGVQRGQARTPIQVGVAKIDYSKQLNEKLKLEAGAKGTFTRSTSLSKIEGLENGQWIGNSTTSNDIKMHEGIGALYTSFNYQLSKSVSILAGARYEYSNTQMEAEKEENKIDRKFGKIFPSVFLSKKLNDNSDLQLSYTKRISRPSYNDLASYITYNDPVSVFTGNPALRPVITNNLKLGYNYQGYSFSLLLSRDDHPIARTQVVTNPEGNLIYISPQNLEYQNNLTFQTYLPFNVTKWWSINGSFVGGFRQFKLTHTAQKVEKTYFGYTLSGGQTFKLPGSLSIEISGWYLSSFYNGSVKFDGFGMLNGGIKKELNNKMGSIQLTVSDLIRSMNIKSYFGKVTHEAFSLNSYVSYNTESRKTYIVNLTYSKSFGDNKVRGQRQRGVGSRDEQDRIKKN